MKPIEFVATIEKSTTITREGGGFRIWLDTPDHMAYSQLGIIANTPGIVVKCIIEVSDSDLEDD